MGDDAPPFRPAVRLATQLRQKELIMQIPNPVTPFDRLKERGSQASSAFRKSTAGLAVAAVASVLTACSGVGVDFEREFDAIQTGATRAQVLTMLRTSPYKTDTSDVGGFSYTRIEIVDVKSKYVFTLAGTPLTEPRLVAKTRTPHFN